LEWSSENSMPLPNIRILQYLTRLNWWWALPIPGGAAYTRKEIDGLVDWIRRPQIGAKGMVYAKYNDDGSFKSSVDKFYDQEDLARWAEATGQNQET